MGAKNVLVSLGGDGALLVDEFGKVHKEGVIKGHKVLNTVGSGDSMVAGFVAGCIDQKRLRLCVKARQCLRKCNSIFKRTCHKR